MINFIDMLVQSTNIELDNSFDDFHSPGVSYLCLMRSRKLTVKLYHFDVEKLKPVWDLWGREIVVNPHTHRYAFQTYVLRGLLTNVEYEAKPHYDSRPYYVNEFTHGLGAQAPFVKSTGMEWLRTKSIETMTPGHGYVCETSSIHSVIPHPTINTIIFIVQYQNELTKNELFTPSNEAVEFDGLYKPLTNEKAYRILGEAQEAIQKLRG